MQPFDDRGIFDKRYEATFSPAIVAVGIALKTLQNKKMLKTDVLPDETGEPYIVYTPTEYGEEWLIANQNKLTLNKKQGKTEEDDDAPF